MAFPLKHSTLMGKKTSSGSVGGGYSTPDWSPSHPLNSWCNLGKNNTHLLQSFEEGINTSTELEQTKWLRIGASSGSYSDYNFLNGGHTKFAGIILFHGGLYNYAGTSSSNLFRANAVRHVLFDHTDDHNDSGIPGDGFMIGLEPASGSTGTFNAPYFYVNGTKLKAGGYASLLAGSYANAIAFSYDSSLGSDNMKIIGKVSFDYFGFASNTTVATADETDVVSVTGNPIIGRAKQQVVYLTNNIVKIVADGTNPATITFAADHAALRRGTQFTISSGTTNFNATHTILDTLTPTTCQIANASGHATEGSDGSPLNATWAYRTYEPMSRGPNEFSYNAKIHSMVFWDNASPTTSELNRLANDLYGQGGAVNVNTYTSESGNLTPGKVYSWHEFGGGLEQGVFTPTSNKIHNMSAQGGWMRNTVDRDINTDFVSGTDNDQKFNSQCTNISGSLATTTTGGGE